ELLVRLREIARLHARAERQRLLLQRGLRFGERLAHGCCLLGSRTLRIDLLPGCRDQLPLAPRNVGLVVLLAAAAPAATTAAALLRLRELALKRVDLDEADVGLRLGV